MEHPIEGLMSTAMEQLKEMVDVNTIIGEPVETHDGTTIMTVSKVRFGFATGGSDYQSEMDSMDMNSGSSLHPFGGGSGGGVSITPIAFLIVGKEGVRMHHLNDGTHLLEKLMDLAPGAISKIQQQWNQGNQKHYSDDSQRYQ
ncbi:GerW family sporulation protein [Jeotgalibacillus proteolyticus]|uniref:Sporulation protein YtfJ n=1 Tax=Jeotgalibacillus proteolyticus TaxID=2082395 RepID=A0A2S5GFF0_9BACL|nr:GerW family sporulation protein [Jeotgalibacillus proteolyticus]PPA71641.1 sporulation protein YtfJ [Jeotgalibacillus proteolyticus]